MKEEFRVYSPHHPEDVLAVRKFISEIPDVHLRMHLRIGMNWSMHLVPVLRHRKMRRPGMNRHTKRAVAIGFKSMNKLKIDVRLTALFMDDAFIFTQLEKDKSKIDIRNFIYTLTDDGEAIIWDKRRKMCETFTETIYGHSIYARPTPSE